METADHLLCEGKAFTTTRRRIFDRETVELTNYSTLKTSILCEVGRILQRKLLNSSLAIVS